MIELSPNAAQKLDLWQQLAVCEISSWQMRLLWLTLES